VKHIQAGFLAYGSS